MHITRRNFLLASVSTLAISGTYGVFKWFTAKPEDIITAIIQRRLGYLNINDDDIAKFSKSYTMNKTDHVKKLTLLSVFATPLQYFTPYPYLQYKHSFHRLEDSVVSLFLLSTNFFQNNANEKIKIQYLGFYDPFNTVCRNPLMRQINS